MFDGEGRLEQFRIGAPSLNVLQRGAREYRLFIGTNNIGVLFEDDVVTESGRGPSTEKITRIDYDDELRAKLLPLCRLRPGEIWTDPLKGHRVGLLDATKRGDYEALLSNERPRLAVNDPPYNIRMGNKSTDALFNLKLEEYIKFSREWARNVVDSLAEHATFYVWLGADYKSDFQPLPDFMIMMRDYPELRPRNYITMRNQRGYGTQQNWMWVRQELLHYAKNKPPFHVAAEYTEIPKILKGYYKVVNGRRTENLERSKSDMIRAGNVWVDVQQVFYRMIENVPGCYAQKPLKAIERIITASSDREDLVVDLFSHSGTTLVAGEKLDRRVYTADKDPIFAELTIRRLERHRATGLEGWQWHSPFPEVAL